MFNGLGNAGRHPENSNDEGLPWPRALLDTTYGGEWEYFVDSKDETSLWVEGIYIRSKLDL